MTATIVGRAMTALAAILLLVAALLAVLPNPGIVDRVPDGTMRVNCGSLLTAGKYSGDHGCEDRFIRRVEWTLLPVLPALALGSAGLIVVHRGRRPRGALPAEPKRAR